MKKYSILITLVFMSAFGLPVLAYAGDGDPQSGAKLWKKLGCKNCHKLSERTKIGPGIKGVTKRHSDKWLIKWLMDPQAVWSANEGETKELRKWRADRAKAKKTLMRIRKISDQECDDLMAFIRKNDEEK